MNRMAMVQLGRLVQEIPVKGGHVGARDERGVRLRVVVDGGVGWERDGEGLVGVIDCDEGDVEIAGGAPDKGVGPIC